MFSVVPRQQRSPLKRSFSGERYLTFFISAGNELKEAC